MRRRASLRASRRPRTGLPDDAARRGAAARRGSVTVMAGVFMVMMTMFAGVAIDATRLFSERAQLQTLTDAAALAGAVQILRDSSVAVDTARVYAGRNGLRTTGGDAADVVDVTTGVWSPAAGAFIAGGDPADAIEVAASRRVNFLVAQILGSAGTRVTARSTAWASAPVNHSNSCMKPVMLPMSFMDDILHPPGGIMTPDDMRRLREMTQAERTGTIQYGGIPYGTPSSPPDLSSVNGKYLAATFPGSNGDPPPDVREAIRACQSAPVGSGDTLVVARQNDPVNEVLQGVRELCTEDVANGGQGGAYANGTCFVGGQPVGVPLKVAFWGSVFPSNGGYGAEVEMVGSFTVTHIEDLDGEEDETPVRLPSWGSLTGFLSFQEDFGTVGNAASTLRRAILVQ